jgi:hypothetical protein
VARHRNHRPTTTHPKLLLIMFPDPWATFVALVRRRCAHMGVSKAYLSRGWRYLLSMHRVKYIQGSVSGVGGGLRLVYFGWPNGT